MSRVQLMRSIARDERPRERLLRLGPSTLSTPELVAVLLRTGSANRDVLALAAVLLETAGGVAGLAGMPLAEILALEGVGPAKAATLGAALELGRRAAESELSEGSVLNRPESAGKYLVARLRGRPTEVFGYLALNGRHRLLQVRELSAGTRRYAPVDAAELFRRALLDGASGVLLFHNHPSGSPEPSADDRLLTRRLAAAGATLGVPVLDHLIVAGARWVSLRSDEPGLFTAGDP